MRLLGNVLRVYSYIFETVLCGMGLLLTIFTQASSNVEVRVAWLPWAASNQMRWVAGLSMLGLLLVGLAVFGTLRVLLFLFSGAVVYILVRGLFINTQYAFTGASDARNGAWLVIAAFVAFLGAYPMSPRRRRV